MAQEVQPYPLIAAAAQHAAASRPVLSTETLDKYFFKVLVSMLVFQAHRQALLARDSTSASNPYLTTSDVAPVYSLDLAAIQVSDALKCEACLYSVL